MPDTPADEPGSFPIVLKLLSEEAVVTTRQLLRRRVRVRTVTRERPRVLRESLAREEVTVERVAIGRQVDAIPPVRTEGDVTILPVVEERLVVERRLFLVEEVRVRRARSDREWTDTVMERYQDVLVEHADVPEPADEVGVGRAPESKEDDHG